MQFYSPEAASCFSPLMSFVVYVEKVDERGGLISCACYSLQIHLMFLTLTKHVNFLSKLPCKLFLVNLGFFCLVNLTFLFQSLICHANN